MNNNNIIIISKKKKGFIPYFQSYFILKYKKLV